MLCQGLLLAMGLYKAHSSALSAVVAQLTDAVGLLPTASSDWLAFLSPPPVRSVLFSRISDGSGHWAVGSLTRLWDVIRAKSGSSSRPPDLPADMAFTCIANHHMYIRLTSLRRLSGDDVPRAGTRRPTRTTSVL